MMITWLIVQILFGLVFLFPFILFIVNKIGDKPSLNFQINNTLPNYAIIVTAYEETGLLKTVVDSLLRLNYKNYLIYVVADNCDVSELLFDNDKVVVLRPPQVLASNVKSHFYAINNFVQKHDRITIIDSDNLVDPYYLDELNLTFDQGFMAVQGVRRAKKTDTAYAALDEAGDIYYRFVDRKLLFEAGSSASLAGSGMAFTTELFLECMEERQLMGAGFDKILQFEIIKRGHRIAFSEKAVVYDEKTAKSNQLVKQRARWINTWFKFFKLGLKLFAYGLTKPNLNAFLFSLLLLRPPLFIMIGLTGLFMVANIFLSPLVLIYYAVFLSCFVFIFFKSLSYFKASPIIYKSLKSIPKFIFLQILAFANVTRANKLSVATKHVDPS